MEPLIVVVGAGAAGLMAAGWAARAGTRKVILLERTRDGGRKILISGGGRCNILPSAVDPGQYVTASSPNIVKLLLRRWPLPEQRRFFEEELGIALKVEEESGKLFPVSDKAREVRDRLVGWVRELGVDVQFGVSVAGLRRGPDEGGGTGDAGGWEVVTELGVIHASRVILATGGLSVPQTGSDGTGLQILEALGHTLNPTYPALTPLTLHPNPYAELAGVSLPVTITSGAGKKAFRTTGSFLFTHRGFSGPAALNASHVAIRRAAPARPSGAARGAPPHDAPTTHAPPLAGPTLLVSWGPLTRDDWERELIGGTRHVVNVLKAHLPERLAEHLYKESGIAAERSVAQLRKEERARLLDLLTAYPLPVTGDEGYKKAEVTGGGAALEEFVTQSLESRKHPGLFVCGEALDCFGPIGGYNFHWAWATGRVAGEGAGAR